jgi:predicted amidophosphoribosyltransferase
VQVGYRSRIQRPASVGWTADDWVAWLAGEHLIMPVLGASQPVCELCYRPAVTDEAGVAFRRCYNCHAFVADQVDQLVPISYSHAGGLESPLRAYKSFGPEHRWLRVPLGALLRGFLNRHWACIEGLAGRIDLACTMPYHPDDGRDWYPLQELVTATNGWQGRPWDLTAVTKTRPGKVTKKALDPTVFQARVDLTGAAVLAVDDTFTSGASMASLACALRQAGAQRVVAVTLGRQLNPEWHPESAPVLAEQWDKPFDLARCVLE